MAVSSVPRQLLGWPLPSLGDLIFLAVFLGVLASGTLVLNPTSDPGRHLVVGELILSTGGFPRQDPFSITMEGEPFVPHSWLAEVLSAASYRWAGAAGLVMLHALVIGLALGFLYWHLRLRGHGPLLATGVTLLALIVSEIHWQARPHVFTFLGMVVFTAVLDLWHRGRLADRWLWGLPAAMVVWANLHAGFLVGLLIVGVYLAAEGFHWWVGVGDEASVEAARRVRQLSVLAVLTGAASYATPAGASLLPHVISYLAENPAVDRIPEYRSPNFHQFAFYPFLAMLLGTAFALAWSRRRPALHEGLLFLAFGALSLHAARNIPLFAIVAAPLLASQLEGLPAPQGWAGGLWDDGQRWLGRASLVIRRVEPGLGWHLWPLVAVVVAAGVTSIQWRAGQAPLGIEFDAKFVPVGAVRHLRANPPAGNGFNQFAWSGYLLHQLWPAQRVFIDGQSFYGKAETCAYLQVAGLGPRWREVLDHHQIRWVVVGSDWPLVRVLEKTSGWRLAYQDRLAAVLLRDQMPADGTPLAITAEPREQNTGAPLFECPERALDVLL